MDDQVAYSSTQASGSNGFETPKIHRTPIGDQVYSIVWQQIITHRLRPGDKLSDVRLSAELGVSRTPVREALHRLAQDGIVRSESRRGFTVATFSTQDVREVYDIRTALEIMAVRLAAPHLTIDQIDSAQRALDEGYNRVLQGGGGARDLWLQVDRDFHRMIASATQNNRLVSVLDSLWAQIRVFHVHVTHTLPIQQRVIDQHRLILDALRRNDSTAAADAMEQHIQSVKNHLLTEFVTHESAPPPG